jgi:murein DD-endopeptidase MepM/ murein hydrolase activator NlpD
MSTRNAGLVATALVVASFAVTTAASAADAGVADAGATGPFSYDPPGQLVAGSGKGRVDMNVYAPNMRFPMESGPAFANSQVWGHGGNEGTGGQCDKENFSYPWHDNYCETRDWDMPLCPGGQGHQGQDIRAASCKAGVHPTVAVADGTITSIGSYSVYLTTADGTRFDYLHMQDVAVKEGQKVKRGDPMGKVSNQFGGSATTVHLHFNIKQNVAGVGSVYVPGYLSLVKSYEAMISPPVPDASVPEPPPPAAKPAPFKAEPTEPDPVAPPAEEDSGCTFAPASARPSGTTESFGAVLALAALGIAIARRHKRRAS